VTDLVPKERPHVLIIGGGFGGLAAARALARAPVDVTLIDRANFHLFQPLLYQVAMAGLSPAEIAIPIRTVLRRQKNARVLLGEVMSIDLDRHRVDLAEGMVLTYDFLIVAAGARTTYFGHDEWARYALGLKSVEDAIEVRRRVLLEFEYAERCEDDAERRRHLTFVVIGAGPTGAELAGALAELARKVLAKDFRRINPSSARVVLLEGGPRVLPSFHEALSASAQSQLEGLGVEVRTKTMVKSIDEHGVHLENETIESGVVIWAAGVSASPLAKQLGVELDRAGRVPVKDDSSVGDHPEVFAIGDIARFEEDGKPLPGVSPVAMQQGRAVAANIVRTLRGEARESFHYFDKGSMATIGRSRAIAEIGRVKLSGLVAWFAWLFIHIWYLVGFKNRVFVLMQWIFSYVMYRRGARLITGPRLPDGR
jgi:NADH:ubiquinone reductase (H+-translocating)